MISVKQKFLKLNCLKNCLTEELYNSVSFDSVEWSDLYKTLNNTICNECINHIVNVNDGENSIKKLKPGKSDGFDGLTSDYLINAPPLFYVYLSHLFTTMLYYCFTPKSFCISTMILYQKAQTMIHLISETTEV